MGGGDFHSVLKAVSSVADSQTDIPRCEKWSNAGEIMANSYSIAWRVLDAQYWGVPQRRKRIYLVGDFTGQCAGKILFESEGLSGYSAESFREWKKATKSATPCTGTANNVCLNDQGGRRMDVTFDVTNTLRAEMRGHAPCVVESTVSCNNKATETESASPTVYENHAADARCTGPLDVSPTVCARYGTGGNNQPFVVECIQGSMIGRDDKNGPQGSGVNENVSFTLNTVDRHAVAYSTSKGSYHTQAEKNLVNTLLASDYKDPPAVYYSTDGEKMEQSSQTTEENNSEQARYTVRRITPTECARLQGFPDWWCADLATENPTEADVSFWRDVFETHRKVIGKSSKAKTDSQIIKWLKDPYTDSAEYKMWGNGIALPCAWFVLAGIAYFAQESAPTEEM